MTAGRILGRCPTQKTGYRNKGQARSALDTVRHKQVRLGVPEHMRVRSFYQCRLCPHWHLTKQEPN